MQTPQAYNSHGDQCQYRTTGQWSAAREVRETHDDQTLPIVALTALGNVTMRKRCMEAGFNEVIVKPVTNREVIECVRRYV